MGPRRKKAGPLEEREGGVNRSRCTGGEVQCHWTPLSPFEQLPSAPHLGLMDVKCSSILKGKPTAIANYFHSQGNTKAFRGHLRMCQGRDSRHWHRQPTRLEQAETAAAAVPAKSCSHISFLAFLCPASLPKLLKGWHRTRLSFLWG